MKRILVRLFCTIALFAGFVSLIPTGVQGQAPQQAIVQPTELYRFNVSASDGGFLLTGSWQEGLAWGYNQPLAPMQMNRGNFAWMGIYVPPGPGWTPDPSAGLVPLHRWLVIQDGWRNYYYYSTFFSQHGSDYYYHGIQGYVLPANQTTFRGTPVTKLSSWYSQSYGYWNGTGAPVADAGFFIELPPHSSYAFHGTICTVPGAITSTRFPTPPVFPTNWDVVFFAPQPPPPPPPPPPCSASQSLINKCYQLGGMWNSEGCYCEY
jgi:hypothetical protein